MSDRINIQGQSYSNGEMATVTLNSLIWSVVSNASIDSQTGRRKNYCDLLVFGYGDYIKPLLNTSGAPVSVPDLADNPRGHHRVRVKKYDPATGQSAWVDETQPYWIECIANSKRTETARALASAYDAVQRWLMADQRRRQSFPPIVLNVTDGQHNGAGDPIQEAHKLFQIGTEDGQVLLFNCHLTHMSTQALIFPSDIMQIRAMNLPQQEQRGAEQLFEMSSLIPTSMIQRARDVFNIGLTPGIRGFMYNADAHYLINFLNWGTRQSQGFVG